jgi:multidrug transporter EmrE-like cation transporter
VHWIFLIFAGAFEIGFTACLKMSNGFTRLWWYLAFVLSAGISFLFRNLSIAVIPLGTAYAIWTGIGAAGMNEADGGRYRTHLGPSGSRRKGTLAWPYTNRSRYGGM